MDGLYYAQKEVKPQNNMTEKMMASIEKNQSIQDFLYNDLEYAIFNDYEDLQKIKCAYPNAIMSGSGSTYFVLEQIENSNLSNEYLFINELKFIPNGVSICD